jgi:hypothetical protein
LDRIQLKEAAPTQDQKEIIMHANGQTTVWGTYRGVSRAQDAKGWYQLLREWWAAHKVARHEARLATLKARWDAKREALKPLRTDPAAEMVATEHTFSTSITFYGLANS